MRELELYIGGLNQGKLGYVLEKYRLSRESSSLCDGISCTREEVLEKKIINHYHEFIKRLLQDGEDPEAFTEELIRLNPGAVIICNEVGSGVVPMERADRRFREAVGHCTQRIAARAGHVERIFCGLGMVLKTLPD